MPYMMFIVEDRDERGARPTAERQTKFERMMGWTNGLKARGLCSSSSSLKLDHEAVRIVPRGGKRAVVDGPFAEAKEMIGGYLILECATKDEAIALASECPVLDWGGRIEVREMAPCNEE